MAFRWLATKRSRPWRGRGCGACAPGANGQPPRADPGCGSGAGRTQSLPPGTRSPAVARRIEAAPAARRPRRRGFHFGACLLLALVLLASPAAAAMRVVSLNLCTDQLLVLLAPQEIAALSPLARDPALSFVARRAASLPVVRPSAEAVLRLHPDLILAGPYGAQTTVALLEAEGLAIHRITLPRTFAAIRAQTLRLAVLLGVKARGAALVGRMDATLAAIRPPPHPLTAIAWEPRGYTDGPASLMGAILRAAGLTNLSNGGRLGLEALLRRRPDMLVVPQAPRFPSLATDLLQSPVLAAIPRRALPAALTLCAGPFTARAVAMLAR